MEILYRDNYLFGDAIREVHSVIFYETFVLGNMDIIMQCMQYMSDKTRKDAEWIVFNFREEYGCGVSMDDRISFTKSLVRDIREHTGKNISYALWLAEKRTLLESYKADPDGLDGYVTSDVILSDIMPDGRLYGYTEPQYPAIKSERTMECGLPFELIRLDGEFAGVDL